MSSKQWPDRKTPRVQNKTVYLGQPDESVTRVTHIQQLAHALTGDSNFSRFIQKLGDGEFDHLLLPK